MTKTEKILKDVRHYIKEDNDFLISLAVYNTYSLPCAKAYNYICGGFIEGVHEWASDNIDFIQISTNKKYTGYTIYMFDSYGASTIEKRLYIENKILNIKPQNWQHAKNVFNKYLKQA